MKCSILFLLIVIGYTAALQSIFTSILGSNQTNKYQLQPTSFRPQIPPVFNASTQLSPHSTIPKPKLRDALIFTAGAIVTKVVSKLPKKCNGEIRINGDIPATKVMRNVKTN